MIFIWNWLERFRIEFQSWDLSKQDWTWRYSFIFPISLDQSKPHYSGSVKYGLSERPQAEAIRRNLSSNCSLSAVLLHDEKHTARLLDYKLMNTINQQKWTKILTFAEWSTFKYDEPDQILQSFDLVRL